MFLCHLGNSRQRNVHLNKTDQSLFFRFHLEAKFLLVWDASAHLNIHTNLNKSTNATKNSGLPLPYVKPASPYTPATPPADLHTSPHLILDTQDLYIFVCLPFPYEYSGSAPRHKPLPSIYGLTNVPQFFALPKHPYKTTRTCPKVYKECISSVLNKLHLAQRFKVQPPHLLTPAAGRQT